jgi:uncharacterized protein YcfJ
LPNVAQNLTAVSRVSPPFSLDMRYSQRTYRHLAAIVAATVLTTMSLAAQAAPAPVAVGARVRLTLPEPGQRRFGVRPPERWLVGELVAATADTLAVRPHPLLEPVRVPRSALVRLDVSRGAPSRWQSAASGVVGGALLGVLWGHVLYGYGLHGHRFDSQARARTTGAVFGAATAAFVGVPTERWRRIALQ